MEPNPNDCILRLNIPEGRSGKVEIKHGTITGCVPVVSKRQWVLTG